jgi:hypothetical protein
MTAEPATGKPKPNLQVSSGGQAYPSQQLLHNASPRHPLYMPRSKAY